MTPAAYFDLARMFAAANSDDPKTKVGCVVEPVDVKRHGHFLGTNRLPPGVRHDSYRVSSEKHLYLEHAERDALASMARAGVSATGGTLFIPWFPCAPCARAIVGHGIREVHACWPDFGDPKWGPDFRASLSIFEESGVSMFFHNP